MTVSGLRLGVDVGGTFTDVVAVDGEGRAVIEKVPSTPQDRSAGALAGWQALDVPAGRVAMFAHGTTVATNALLERRGGRTAVVTTEGFGDLIEIGRQDLASLYDLTRHRPPPLVPRELRFVVRERMVLAVSSSRWTRPAWKWPSRRWPRPRSRRSRCVCCSASCTPSTSVRFGRVKSTQTRPGNPYLKGALGIAAMSAAKGKSTYLGAKYRRIAARRGPMEALVAVERAIFVAIWNMLNTGAFYSEPGGDFYTKRNPDKAKQRAVDQLGQMGYEVTLSTLPAAS